MLFYIKPARQFKAFQRNGLVMEKAICAATILCSFSGVRPNMAGIPVYVRGSECDNECAYCRQKESPLWRKGFPFLDAQGRMFYANACNRCALKEAKKNQWLKEIV